MYCSKCGKEIADDAKFCVYCGASNENGNTKIVLQEGKKKKNKKVLWIVLALVVLSCIIAPFLSDDSETKPHKNEQEIIDELSTFTTLYKDEEGGRYFFLENNEEKWAISYNEVNTTVIFENDVVAKCFTEAFGEDCFDEDSMSYGGFLYAIADDEARIYLDVEIDEGHLSIVNYNFEDEEYVLNLNGEKYETTDVFDDFVEKYELASTMQKNITSFKETLAKHDISLEDLLDIQYKTIDEQFVPEEQSTKDENASSDTGTEVQNSDANTEAPEDNAETKNPAASFTGAIGTYEVKYIDDEANGRIEFGNIVDGQMSFNLYVFELDYNVMTGNAKIINENTAQYSDGTLTITFTWTSSNEICVTNSGEYMGMDGYTIDRITDNVTYVWSTEFN